MTHIFYDCYENSNLIYLRPFKCTYSIFYLFTYTPDLLDWPEHEKWSSCSHQAHSVLTVQKLKPKNGSCLSPSQLLLPISY